MSHNINTINTTHHDGVVEHIKLRCVTHNINTINITHHDGGVEQIKFRHRSHNIKISYGVFTFMAI
jgi:hypothetical protein